MRQRTIRVSAVTARALAADRPNPRQRQLVIRLLIERDGYSCRICGVPGSEKPLVPDRIDNTGSHKDLNNLQLLCKSCNTSKDPRGLGRFNPKREDTWEEVRGRKVSTVEMERNLRCETPFRQWLYRELMQTAEMVLEDVKNEGAELVHCSQDTIHRYVKKATTRFGPFELTKNAEGDRVVRLRRVPVVEVETVLR